MPKYRVTVRCKAIYEILVLLVYICECFCNQTTADIHLPKEQFLPAQITHRRVKCYPRINKHIIIALNQRCSCALMLKTFWLISHVSTRWPSQQKEQESL